MDAKYESLYSLSINSEIKSVLNSGSTNASFFKCSANFSFSSTESNLSFMLNDLSTEPGTLTLSQALNHSFSRDEANNNTGIPLDLINVTIDLDSAPSNQTTPYVFGLIGSPHMFMVAPRDQNGHYFKEWNTNETANMIEAHSDGIFTAYYQAIYVLNITTTTGGTTNPAPTPSIL